MRLISILLVITSTTFAQTDTQVDSLIAVMCKSIHASQKIPDSTQLLMVYGQYLFPFVDRFDEDRREKISETIYYRFQRNCRDFSDLLDRLDPPKGGWEKIPHKPTSNLTKKDCRDFLKHRRYTYYESNGDLVNLTIENGYWTDHFKDGSYSRLKFGWINDHEFEIEFMESNNSTRSKFSKKGDKYLYQLIDKTDDYYVMVVQIAETEGYYRFHLGY